MRTRAKANPLENCRAVPLSGSCGRPTRWVRPQAEVAKVQHLVKPHIPSIMAYRVGLELFSVALIIGVILGVGLPVAGLCSGRCCWLNQVISLMNSHFQPYPYHLVEPSPWPLAASM